MRKKCILRKARKVLVMCLVGGVIFSFAAVDVGFAQKPTIEIWGCSSFVADVNNWVVQKAQEWAAQKGVEVRVSLFPFSQLNAKLIAAVEAGTPPDMCVQAWGVGEWVHKGLLLPLDPSCDFSYQNGTCQPSCGSYVLPSYNLCSFCYLDAQGLLSRDTKRPL